GVVEPVPDPPLAPQPSLGQRRVSMHRLAEHDRAWRIWVQKTIDGKQAELVTALGQIVAHERRAQAARIEQLRGGFQGQLDEPRKQLASAGTLEKGITTAIQRLDALSAKIEERLNDDEMTRSAGRPIATTRH